MRRLIAGACLISLSACSASGLSLGLGAGDTVAGGSLLLSQEEVPDCDPLERATTGCIHSASVEAGNALATAAGLTLVGFGVLLMGLGAWGIASEHEAPEPHGLALVPSQAPTSAAPGRTAAASAPSATSTGDEPQRRKLAAHVQFAAHANRCGAAVYLLKRLRTLDEARALSLVESDAEVARCAQLSATSLRG